MLWIFLEEHGTWPFPISVTDCFIPVSLLPASLLSPYHISLYVTTASHTDFGAVSLSVKNVILFIVSLNLISLYVQECLALALAGLMSSWLVFAAEALTFLSLWVILTEKIWLLLLGQQQGLIEK